MPTHRNNVGVLRLLFASLVIIGHAPEMTDGNRTREPLTLVFHTLPLGDLAVDAFFLLSGYLITQSMHRAPTLRVYLERRVLRIYPAFIAATLASVFLLGPFVGAHPWHALPKTIVRMLLLQQPAAYPGQLAGLPYPELNAAMWTITYEFRCYLLIAALGITGLLTRRRLILAATAIGLVACMAINVPAIRAAYEAWGGPGATHPADIAPSQNLRLTTIFLIGACVYLYRETIFPRLTPRLALFCAIAAATLMYRNIVLAEAALTTFGAVTLFWLAFKADLGPLQRINDQWDISYGLYLYGWPAATLILWLNPAISPWSLAAMALPLAALCGAISWWGLEAPVQHWAKHRGRMAVA